MLIRRATQKDAESIIQNNINCAKESENVILDKSTVSKGVKAVINDRLKGFYLVVEQDGTIIGQTMITYEWSDWNNNTIWWIQSVYIDKSWRQKGVFSTLYKDIQNQAKKQGVSLLRLYVHHNNTKAITVYKKLDMDNGPYHIYQYFI